MKEAVARLGRPVAASVMGLGMVPCIWMEKLKLVEVPEEMVWVAVPVEARVKSGPIVVPVPMVIEAAVEMLEVKFASPL